MVKLEALENFIRIVDAGGIGKAAEQLGIAKSAVSRRLQELEDELGARLLSRTTRKISLTEAGNRCYQQAKPILEAADELEQNVSANTQALSGILRVSVPLSFGLAFFPQVMNAFCQLHPQIKIEIEFSDAFVDLVEMGIDVAIRIGELKDSSLHAKKLFPVEILLVASPDYIAKQGGIDDPKGLRHCELLKYKSAHNHFELMDHKGNIHKVFIPIKMTANNGDFLNSMAKQGYGVTASPNFICQSDINSRQLVRILPQFQLPSRHAYAVYPAAQHLPHKVRVFIDFLAEYFANHEASDFTMNE